MNIVKEKEEFINAIKELPDDVFAEIRDFTEFIIQRKKIKLSRFTEKIISEDHGLLKRLAE